MRLLDIFSEIGFEGCGFYEGLLLILGDGTVRLCTVRWMALFGELKNLNLTRVYSVFILTWSWVSILFSTSVFRLSTYQDI